MQKMLHKDSLTHTQKLSMLLFFLSLVYLTSSVVWAQKTAQPALKQNHKTQKNTNPKKSLQKPLRRTLSMTSKHWLSLGPAPLALPAFHKEKPTVFRASKLLKERHLHLTSLRPQKGQSIDWFVGQKLHWKTGVVVGSPSKQTHSSVLYRASYIQAQRYVEAKLTLKTYGRAQIVLDGKVIATQSRCTPRTKGSARTKTSKVTLRHPTAAKPSLALSARSFSNNALLFQLTQLARQQARTIQKQVELLRKQSQLLEKRDAKKPILRMKTLHARLRLTPGVHRLIIKQLHTPKCHLSWKIKSTLRTNKKVDIRKALWVSTQPKERHSIAFMLQRKQPTSVHISPDGKELIVRLTRKTRSGQTRSWLEWRRTHDGVVLFTTRPQRGVRGIKWSPNGKSYTFIQYDRKTRTSALWIVDRSSKQMRIVRSGIRKLHQYTWSPDGRFFILNIGQHSKPTKIERAGVKRLRGMNDRWPWYRTHTHLYALTLQSGHMVRLTTGKWSIWGPTIRHDGKQLLFVRSHPDYTRRPFSTQTLYSLDLPSLTIKKVLGPLRRLRHFAYSPDGKQLLLTGSASLFGAKGRSPSLGKGIEPNHYDQQGYIYALKTKKVIAFTRTFKPSLGTVYWHSKDRNIYFTALDRVRYRLYRYNVHTQTIQRLTTGVDMAGRFSFARNVLKTAFIGQSVSHPKRVYIQGLDSTQQTARLFLAPSRNWFKRIHLATVKDFVTKSPQGHRIEGRVYLPPQFDPKKKYPAIVYYYGGTYPTTRSFDGRYSGHLWAAHGYVVYKLQPSGAIGFGQKFAARHVNEWGTLVGKEIIHSTRQFLKAHPFVDAKRLGCIGASYGGFTTMSLITQSPMFAAAISHAGISNITSYWGAGFWGFLYSETSAAKRYPWSHTRYFIQQSPLFAAQKIKTPLLLLHGASDTNVPPSESYQMYTALRLLKKPVELVLFKGSDHWILRYRKRILWTQTILAWFDKQLKAQPLWWKRLHGTQQH